MTAKANIENFGDPKPWFCSNCGDRFVNDQNRRNGHSTILKPRKAKAKETDNDR